MGERIFYYLLQAYDPEFPELFKGGGGFRGGQARARKATSSSARHRHDRAPQRAAGAGPHGGRAPRRAGRARGGRRGKLSVAMQDLTDMLRESDYFAGGADARWWRRPTSIAPSRPARAAVAHPRAPARGDAQGHAPHRHRGPSAPASERAVPWCCWASSPSACPARITARVRLAGGGDGRHRARGRAGRASCTPRG